MEKKFSLPLWHGVVPNFKKTDELESQDVIGQISNVQEPDITVHLPAKKDSTGQAIVIMPGGGYSFVAFKGEGTSIAKWLNLKGITSIILKYRLPGSKSNIIPHKSPLLDAQRAVRLTRYYSKDWNIKADKIGIMGFSAGGHLASTLGTHFDYGEDNSSDVIETMSSRPDFMILLYPVITFLEPYLHNGSRTALLGKNPDKKMIEYYSNELQVKEDTPQTFIFHCSNDNEVLVENSLLFYNSLRAKNIPAEMHIYPEGGHGFANSTMLAAGISHLKTWKNCCLNWIRWLDK